MVANSGNSYPIDIPETTRQNLITCISYDDNNCILVLEFWKNYQESEISNKIHEQTEKSLYETPRNVHRNNAAFKNENTNHNETYFLSPVLNTEKYLVNCYLIKPNMDNESFITTKQLVTNKGNINIRNYVKPFLLICYVQQYQKENKYSIGYLITHHHTDEYKDDYLSTALKLPSDTKVRLVGTATLLYDPKNMHSSAALQNAVSEFFVQANMPVNQLLECVADRKNSAGIFNCALSVVTWPSGHQMLDPKVRILQQTNEFNYFIERLQSFLLGTNPLHNIWPDEAVVRPGPLISAGFIYEGNYTEVVCRICGLESNTADWKRDDDDYAMYVHQQSSSPCLFLERYSYLVNVNNISNEINANNLMMNQHNFICNNLSNDDNNSMFMKSKLKRTRY